MKLTKAQRRKIYLEVAKKVAPERWDRGLCHMLNDAAFAPKENLELSDYAIKIFPEFELFAPNHDDGGLWWDNENNPLHTDIDMVSVRIICMLLCAEMTKTENL